jgi:hypothetical protein
LGGSYFPLEIQLFHSLTDTDNQDTSTQNVVISLLLTSTVDNTNSDNAFFRTLWSGVSDDVDNVTDVAMVLATSTTTLTVADAAALSPYSTLLPANSKRQFHYTGSFTTPAMNCSSNVEWFVLESTVGVSESDIAIVRAAMARADSRLNSGGNNNRPTQQLNGRVVDILSGQRVVTSSPSPLSSVAPTAEGTHYLKEKHVHLKKSTTEKALIVGSVALGTTGILDIMVFIVIILLIIKYAKLRRAREAEEQLKQYQISHSHAHGRELVYAEASKGDYNFDGDEEIGGEFNSKFADTVFYIANGENPIHAQVPVNLATIVEEDSQEGSEPGESDAFNEQFVESNPMSNSSHLLVNLNNLSHHNVLAHLQPDSTDAHFHNNRDSNAASQHGFNDYINANLFTSMDYLESHSGGDGGNQGNAMRRDAQPTDSFLKFSLSLSDSVSHDYFANPTYDAGAEVRSVELSGDAFDSNELRAPSRDR